MLIKVRHTTRYSYDSSARYCIQALRLNPPTFAGQKVHEWTVEAPGYADAIHFQDSFGNAVALASFGEPHTSLEITAHGVVETTDTSGVASGLIEPTPIPVFLRHTTLTKSSAAIEILHNEIEGADTLARLHSLMAVIRRHIAYETGMTTTLTPAAEVVTLGKGVCQDHAHVFIAAARALTIPCRYVNGYLVSGATEPEPAHHAWAEAHIPDLGWVGFDIANLICPDERYVRLATGLDAATASPIRGSRPLPLGAAQGQRLDVLVEVRQQQQQAVQQ